MSRVASHDPLLDSEIQSGAGDSISRPTIICRLGSGIAKAILEAACEVFLAPVKRLEHFHDGAGRVARKPAKCLLTQFAFDRNHAVWTSVSFLPSSNPKHTTVLNSVGAEL